MAVGSGVGSTFGISKETTWGTRVAPSRSLRSRTAKADRVSNDVQGMGIQGGALGDIDAHYVETTNGGSLAVELDVTYNDLGILFENLMGTTATVVQQAATAAWLQTHLLGDNLGKSITAQVGAPYRGGTVFPQEVVGAKITQADFSCAVTGILGMSLQLDAKKFDDGQTLAAAAYTTVSKPFHGGQMGFKMGVLASEAAVTGVREVSVSIARALDTEDFTANQSGQKSEQVTNETIKVTGSVTADWLLNTTFQSLVVNKTRKSIVWEFIGPTAIASTYFPTFRITIPNVVFTGSMQGVEGRAELTNQWGFEWKFDGTNFPKIEYMSTDVAI